SASSSLRFAAQIVSSSSSAGQGRTSNGSRSDTTSRVPPSISMSSQKTTGGGRDLRALVVSVRAFSDLRTAPHFSPPGGQPPAHLPGDRCFPKILYIRQFRSLLGGADSAGFRPGGVEGNLFVAKFIGVVKRVQIFGKIPHPQAPEGRRTVSN